MGASPSSKIPDSLNFGPRERELSVQEVVEIAQSKVSHPLRVTIINDLTIKEEGHLALDSQLASQSLGWSPLWDQRAAVVDTIEWWEKVNSGISAEEACRSDIEKILSKF
jgi:nucleoside-diphosphate-sugar epimerase